MPCLFFIMSQILGLEVFGVPSWCSIVVFIISRKKNWVTIYNLISIQRCSIKKVVFKNFAVFTGKHLCWSLFLKKLHNLLKYKLLKLIRKSIQIAGKQFLKLFGNLVMHDLISYSNFLTLFRMGEPKRPPYHFFHCNFYKRRN